MHSEFIKRLHKQLGDTLSETIINSFDIQRPIAVRSNTLRSNREVLEAFCQQQGIDYHDHDLFADSILIDSKDKATLTHSDFYQQGNAYIQSLASQLPVIILNPTANSEVLDLCAAPGSKTSQLAAMMRNTGRIGAVEKSKTRFFKLRDNLNTLGVTNTQCYLKDGASVGRACPERFDYVLVDAPCSSEGRFDLHDPDSLSYWHEKKVKEMQRKQWPLIQSGFLALKPGATMVYSTCTYAIEENEWIVNKLLKRYPNAELINIPLTLDNAISGIEQEKTWRVMPSTLMPGFFIAYIRKIK